MLITTSLSNIQFEHKPTKEEKKHIPFQKQTLDVKQLYNHIINGGAFCNIYDFTGTIVFKGKGIKTDHYIGSQTINIDLDHQSDTMEETFNRISPKPTFCYTTSSNGTFNEITGIIEYAYRFIYVFDEIVYGKEDYCNLYHIICTLENLHFDKNARSPYQNMFGNRNCTSKFTEIIYSFKDFSFNPIDSLESIENKRCKTNNITTTHQHIINGFAPFIEEEFYSDFKQNIFSDIVIKYKDKLRNVQRSEIPFVDENTMMIDLPDDFFEIRRIFSLHKESKGRCKKIVYGQHRKKSLYCNLMIRRLITPDLTPTELLYNLCYEMEFYIDNTNREHPITKSDLMHIVGTVIEADLETFRQNYKRPRNRMVNIRYVNKHNMDKRSVANKANAESHRKKKEELYAQIGEYYDCMLNNKENLEILADNGIHISIDTLKRFKKKYGLTRGYKKNIEKSEQNEKIKLEPVSSMNEVETVNQPIDIPISNNSNIKNGTFKLRPIGTKISSSIDLNFDLELDSISHTSLFNSPVMKRKSDNTVSIYEPKSKKLVDSLF